MSNDPPRLRVSNEVLEERLTNYFERTMSGIASLREDMHRFETRLERTEIALLDGHPRTIERVLNQEMKLSSLEKEITAIKESSIFKEGVKTGQTQSLSFIDKFILRWFLPIGGALLALYTVVEKQ